MTYAWFVQQCDVLPPAFLTGDGRWGGIAAGATFPGYAAAAAAVCPNGSFGEPVRMRVELATGGA